MGPLRWQLVLCLLVAWIFIFLCLCKGVKTSGKVVYVTATLPFLLLFVFLVRGCTLPGSLEGIKFYVIPKWEKLLTFQPWGDAAMQLFYSVGAAWGALITMSSYNNFKNNFYRDALIVSLADTFTAFFAGLVIFSIIGFMAYETGSEIGEVVTHGPGLVFVVYPEAVANFPVSPLWAVLFFIFLFTVGVDSQFGMFETLISAFLDEYPQLRSKKILFTACLCVLQFLLGLPCVTHGGIYFLQIMDWYSSTFSLMVLSLSECLVISWVYGAKRFLNDISLMLGYTIPRWWEICWRFITPILIAFVLALSIINHKAVTYGDYQYPGWAVGIGWVFALCSMLPIPIIFIIKAKKYQGTGSFWDGIKKASQPEPDWGPAEPERMAEYHLLHPPRNRSFSTNNADVVIPLKSDIEIESRLPKV